MRVEIWDGVCTGLDTTYDTEVLAYRDKGLVFINQLGDFDSGEDSGRYDHIVMGESEAIDIALCILSELAPGMFYNLKKDD